MLDSRRNLFNTVAVVESEIHAVIKLAESGVMTLVDENGREVDMKPFVEQHLTIADKRIQMLIEGFNEKTAGKQENVSVCIRLAMRPVR